MAVGRSGPVTAGRVNQAAAAITDSRLFGDQIPQSRPPGALYSAGHPGDHRHRRPTAASAGALSWRNSHSSHVSPQQAAVHHIRNRRHQQAARQAQVVNAC